VFRDAELRMIGDRKSIRDDAEPVDGMRDMTEGRVKDELRGLPATAGRISSRVTQPGRLIMLCSDTVLHAMQQCCN